VDAEEFHWLQGSRLLATCIDCRVADSVPGPGHRITVLQSSDFSSLLPNNILSGSPLHYMLNAVNKSLTFTYNDKYILIESIRKSVNVKTIPVTGREDP
jgi:hypothetical protein